MKNIFIRAFLFLLTIGVYGCSNTTAQTDISIPQQAPQETEQVNETVPDLEVSVAIVKASPRRIDSIPEHLRKTAIVNGTIAYVVCKTPEKNKGDISPENVIGLLIDPVLGFKPGNITTNPLFLNRIWEIASQYMDKELYASIINSEAKASALIDQRVTDPNLPIREMMEDIIGIYHLVDGEVVFEPNEHYTYFSKFGFMKLTPFLRESLNK